MSKAIGAVRAGEHGLREASRFYNVPISTLKRHLDGGNEIAVGHHKTEGRPPVLPVWIEHELVKYILEMEQGFFGLTRHDARKLAYQIAETKGLHHRFNKTNKMAGKDWLVGFLIELVLRLHL